jgi:hypothetical protein
MKDCNLENSDLLSKKHDIINDSFKESVLQNLAMINLNMSPFSDTLEITINCLFSEENKIKKILRTLIKKDYPVGIEIGVSH